MFRRKPDFVIGDDYLRRWWMIPRNPWFNIYLHRINRSDDDRALHDHPWWNCSIVLKGGYWEWMPTRVGSRENALKHQICRRIWRGAGSIVFRRAKAAHRLEVAEGEHAWTLFITGPRIREWGFWCPQGWRHWREFTSPDDSSKTGRGCE